MTDHTIDPSTIPLNSRVRFTCSEPSCTFSFVHTWLTADGRAFGDSHCYMHGNTRIPMVITQVEQPAE